MRGAIGASVGLALGLLIGSAEAEEIQWRPVAPASAGQQGPAVSLRAPVANTTSVQQASFNNAPSTDDSLLIRAKVSDSPGQPMPIGPILNDTEPGPTPSPLNPSPLVKDQWGNVISKQVPAGPDIGGGPPLGCDGSCGPCVVSADCGDCGWGCGCWSWCKSLWCGCCGDCCDPCCDPCCPSRPCFWISGEYLLWTIKSAPTPPLVTVNPGGSTNLALGSPGTAVAYGGSGQSFDLRSGGRFTLGFALPCTCNQLGFETTYFFIANSSNNAVFGPSAGVASIGRPFTNGGPPPMTVPPTPPNFQDAEIVAAPAAGINGSVGINTTNQFWGIEENLRYPITCGCNWKLDFLAGFRYLNLAEGLQIGENLTVTQATPPAIFGNAPAQFAADPNFIVVDSFHTSNNFYGGQIGLDAECRWRRWFLGATGKLALGDMHETVSINGSTVISGGPGAGSFPGGLLALQGTNIGQYSRNTFAVVPELGVRLGFYVTERLRAFVGYDVVYASSVVRPGDQIDRNVNPTYQPNNGPPQGAALPAFQFRTTDFWAQGLTAGLEWKY